MKINNKVVAVTGAASGIGRCLVSNLLAEGAKVAASDVDLQGLEGLRPLAPESDLMLSELDVSDRQAMTSWAAAVVEHFGQVDGIINNAGVALSCHAGEQPREDFCWLFDINFWGVVNGTEAFLPYLQSRPQASLVNISSLFGLMSVPSQSAYNAAKFAVRGYSESLRQDLRHSNVVVTTVHPGGIQTNIARNGRHHHDLDGQPTTVAATAELFDNIARTSADAAARAIVKAVKRGQRRLLIGSDARLLDVIQRLCPAYYDRILLPLKALGDRLTRRKAESQPSTRG